MRTPATSPAAAAGRRALARTNERFARVPAPWSPDRGRGLGPAPAGRSRTISRAALVLAHPFPCRMAQTAVGRPLRELDLTDQLGAHPVRSCRAGNSRREWRRGRRERVESTAQLHRCPAGEARADLADVDQLAVGIVHPEEQRTDAAAPALRVGEPPDDELLLLDALGLQPCPPATGHVGRVATLRDHALQRHAARVTEKGRTVARDVIAVAQRRVRSGGVEQRAQCLLALLQRRAGEIAPVEVQEIEDEVDRLVGALAAERVLEGVEAGDAARKDHGRLAVEHGVADSEPACRARNARQARGPVLAVATQQPRRAMLDPAEHAIAVELHLVQPLVAFGGRGDQGGELGSHERWQPRATSAGQRAGLHATRHLRTHAPACGRCLHGLVRVPHAVTLA